MVEEDEFSIFLVVRARQEGLLPGLAEAFRGPPRSLAARRTAWRGSWALKSNNPDIDIELRAADGPDSAELLMSGSAALAREELWRACQALSAWLSTENLDHRLEVYGSADGASPCLVLGNNPVT